jgi:hypothetical protein
MNRITLKAWSEQQQVAAVILIAGLLIFLLCYFLLLPQFRQRQALETRIARMRAKLAESNLLLGEDALIDREQRERRQGNRLRQEWAAAVAHLSDTGEGASNAVGHIDFKMALFDTERRLLEKAAAAHIELPRDLGVHETVKSDQDARVLMHQLRAVERLVGLALDLEIETVRAVHPLAVRMHTAREGGVVYVEEYPVQLQFYGSLRNLYDFLHASLERGTAMVLRNLQVEAASPRNADLLQVDTVMSMLIFVKEPAEAAPVEQRVRLVAPRGY